MTTSRDDAEVFKGAVHLGLFALAVTCLAYNAMTLSVSYHRHSAVNVVVYAGLSWFECRQIRRHLT